MPLDGAAAQHSRRRCTATERIIFTVYVNAHWLLIVNVYAFGSDLTLKTKIDVLIIYFPGCSVPGYGFQITFHFPHRCYFSVVLCLLHYS